MAVVVPRTTFFEGDVNFLYSAKLTVADNTGNFTINLYRTADAIRPRFVFTFGGVDNNIIVQVIDEETGDEESRETLLANFTITLSNIAYNFDICNTTTRGNKNANANAMWTYSNDDLLNMKVLTLAVNTSNVDISNTQFRLSLQLCKAGSSIASAKPTNLGLVLGLTFGLAAIIIIAVVLGVYYYHRNSSKSSIKKLDSILKK
jgi:hypothetical protein